MRTFLNFIIVLLLKAFLQINLTDINIISTMEKSTKKELLGYEGSLVEKVLFVLENSYEDYMEIGHKGQDCLF